MTGFPTPTFDSLTLNAPLPVASGGTGGTTAGAARAGISAAVSGANSDITSLAGLTTPLSQAQGGTGAATIAAANLSRALSVATIAALRLLTASTCTESIVFVQGYSANADGGEGLFIYISSDTTSTDNSGTIIVDASLRRWYRLFEGHEVVATWFGADWTGTNDATTAAQNALNTGLAVLFPMQRSGAAGTYKISSALTMKVGQTVRGHGRGATVIRLVTASMTGFTLVLGAAGMMNVRVKDMTIAAAATGAVGVAFTLGNQTAISNVQFQGCAGGAIIVDRGYYHLAENCVSVPNTSYQAGNFKYWSSVDTDYCFYPTVRDCAVETDGITGSNLGAVDRCVFFRRVVQGNITNFQADSLQNPTPNAVKCIVLQNDCQGCKIVGGSSHGASYGILLEWGSGVAVSPGYTEIISHDVDAFYSAGISLQGSTTGQGILQTTIKGGQLTAAQSLGIPYIYTTYAAKTIIEGVTMNDYSGSHHGWGIATDVQTLVMNVANCIFDGIATAFNFVSSSISGIFAINNQATNVTTPLTTYSNLVGSLNRLASNRGINPFGITTPTLPTSGTQQANVTGSDVMVFLSGGTGVSVLLNSGGIGSSTGPFYIPAGDNITVTYTSAPTWFWIPL